MALLKLAAAAAVAAVASAQGDGRFPAPGKHGSNWDPKYVAQAQATLTQMTLQEKLLMVHGSGGPYVGNVPNNSRLGIPPINLEDGPQGVADGVGQVTCWPSALTIVMSWNTTAFYAYGQALAQEQYLKGTTVMLGPGVNIARTPWNGRTFEYTGEDPFLARTMAFNEVTGIQSVPGVIGCVKHFVENSIETDRSGMSSDVPRRAHFELYMQAFSGAVDAGVGSAMCSYNRVNGTWACENNSTLTQDLKGRFGFQGWVMSDWGATHSTVPAALGGLDQQMPDDSFFGAALATAVANGQVPESRIDDMVMRMLVPYYALGVFANNPATDPSRNLGANATSDAHNALARELAEQSITLLKNTNNFLPQDPTAVRTVVVLGDDSTIHGDGSGGVTVPYVVTPFQGVYTLLNGPYTPPSRPANCTFYNNTDFYQPSNPCVSAASAQDCCAKCSADSSCNAFAYVDGSQCATPPLAALRPRPGAAAKAAKAAAAGGACWKKPDTTGNKTSPGIVAGTCTPLPPPPAGRVNVTAYTGENATIAAQLAAGADLVIVNVATTSSEGMDRADLSLPQWQNDVVYAALAANANVVVVVRCPGACFMPWKEDAPAILYQLMPGQESGNALAAAIFGQVNPSGKLPVSFPEDMDQTWLGSPVNPYQFPGVDRGNGFPEATFSEGLFVGYRWYDAHPDLVPLFPFGHGLSYTAFSYSGLAVGGQITPSASVTISFTVANSGKVAGAEVAQLYIAHPESAEEPPKALKGFQKVLLAPGASTPITFTLAASDVAIFDLATDQFTAVPGTYGILVGSSSQDIRLTGTFTVSAN